MTKREALNGKLYAGNVCRFFACFAVLFAASCGIGAPVNTQTAFRIGDVSGVVYAESFLDVVGARGERPHIWGYSAALRLPKIPGVTAADTMTTGGSSGTLRTRATSIRRTGSVPSANT